MLTLGTIGKYLLSEGGGRGRPKVYERVLGGGVIKRPLAFVNFLKFPASNCCSSFLRSVSKQVFRRLAVFDYKGGGVNKNLLRRQKFDTYQKSCQKIINNGVIREKKDFRTVL